MDEIILFEAAILQARYEAEYNASDSIWSKIFSPGFHKGLEPLYTEYVVEEKNRLLTIFGDGFRAGFKFGLYTEVVNSIGTGKKPTKGSGSKPNFASEELLNSHYEKHGGEFRGAYNDAQEYLKGAQDVIDNGIKVQYQYKGEMRTGYVKFMSNSSKGTAKFEFVGTNLNGDITTYHVESGKSFWKMLNGENVPVINMIE